MRSILLRKQIREIQSSPNRKSNDALSSCFIYSYNMSTCARNVLLLSLETISAIPSEVQAEIGVAYLISRCLALFHLVLVEARSNVVSAARVFRAPITGVIAVSRASCSARNGKHDKRNA